MITVLELLGSLGIFLFGMKIMSDALQRVAGNRLKAILGYMTNNRLMGVLTGSLITAISDNGCEYRHDCHHLDNLLFRLQIQDFGDGFGDCRSWFSAYIFEKSKVERYR